MRQQWVDCILAEVFDTLVVNESINNMPYTE